MNYFKESQNLKLPIINARSSINNLYKRPTNKYFINLLKLSKIKKENLVKNEVIKMQHENSIKKNNKDTGKFKGKLNKFKNDDITVLNISGKTKISRSTSTKKKIRKKKKKYLYSSKDFFNMENKNKLQKSLSYVNLKTIDKEKANFESNFMKLNNFSNIYTANADYIQNKKMLLVDKFSYDNNIYKPDRLGQFDMSAFKNPKKSVGKGIFGHIYYYHNRIRNYKINKYEI